MKNNIELIKRLSLAFGPSGMEDEVRAIIEDELAPLKLKTRTDALGNLIVYPSVRNENAPTVMISAHMDEVGMMITHIEDNGVLRFAEIGGINTSVLAGRRVTVYGHDEKKINGVVATKAVHLQTPEERESPLTYDKLYIDIGANSRSEAEELVEIGDCGVFLSDFVVFGEDDSLIKCKALDDRLGCAILIEILRRIEADKPTLNCNPVFCFTTREETGISGAHVAANTVCPDYAIILETTTVADIAGAEEKNHVAHIGHGGVLSLLDRGSIYDKGFFQYALSFKDEVKVQIKEYVSGGNDTRHIQISRDGCHAIALSAPTRYLHSSSCVLDVRDADEMETLVYKMLCNFQLEKGNKNA